MDGVPDAPRVSRSISPLGPPHLLSIPCDGRGARRPLGQSFRESVGPAALYQVSAANRRDHLLIRRAYEHAMRATEICSLQSKTWAYCRQAGIPVHLSHPLKARAGERFQRIWAATLASISVMFRYAVHSSIYIQTMLKRAPPSCSAGSKRIDTRT